MQFRSRVGQTILALAVLLGLGTTTLFGQQPEQRESTPEPRGALDPLTGDEEAAAERIARADSRVKEVLGAQGVRLVAATPVLIKRGESPEQVDVRKREIEVVLFRPEGEVGALVLVNLQQNGVASVQRLASAQVPFTDDDLNDAFQLALRNPQVQSALGGAASTFHIQRTRSPGTESAATENGVSGLPLRSNDPKDPCSKHRCLQLLFRRGADYLSEPIVTVDLTVKRVMVETRRSQ